MSTHAAAAKAAIARPVLVVVPVYLGFSDTRACLDSVIAAGVPGGMELLVINDASPDAELCAWLQDFAQQHAIRLIKHDHNKGFVASANEAFAMAEGRDVVLLNADTIVSGDWIHRLAKAAEGDSVGTVTPLSNNATLASYPRPWVANVLGDAPDVIDAVCRAVNAGVTVEVPTGVGFCLYITQRCLAATGPFSVEDFGLGYGEEVDFCLRAAALGFRHVAAADVFVAHKGEVSFGATAAARKHGAEAVLQSRHPGFLNAIEAFRHQDPLALARSRIDLARLRGSRKPRILLVTHAWKGGIWRHVEELIALLADAAELLILQPGTNATFSLSWRNPHEAMALDFPADVDALADVLLGVGIDRVHIHHLMGLQEALPRLLRRLGAVYDITLHDYFLLTTQYQLCGADGRFDEAVIDPSAQAFQTGKALLESASRVIAPSQDVAERFRRHVPAAQYVVRPHPEKPSPKLARSARVLVLGGLSKAKGLSLLEAVAAAAANAGEAIHFVLLGYAVDEVRTWPALPLHIRGEYSESELPALIAQEAPDLIWFPAVWPETYSYTLSAAIDAGARIVAPNLGAFPERLADYPAATIVPWNLDVLSLLATLCATARSSAENRAEWPSRFDNRIAYRDWYLQGLQARAPVHAADILTSWLPSRRALTTPAAPTNDLPDVEQLFAAGVLRGHAESRQALLGELKSVQQTRLDNVARADHIAGLNAHVEELGRSLKAYQAECVRLEDAIQSATAHGAELAEANRMISADLDYFRRRVADMESSRSWKLTRPYRVMGEMIMTMRRRIRHWLGQVALSKRRVSIAWEVLRHQGPAALIGRIRDRVGRGEPEQTARHAEYHLQDAIGALSVPSSEQPIATIVIPVHGQHLHTFSCLHSLAVHAGQTPFEVIVVDDLSPEPVSKAMPEVTGVRIFRNTTNLGFIRNCNLAAREARGKYLVFLNNDTLVTEGWLEALLAPLERDQRVGAVGAKLIYPDGTLQEAGGILWRDGSAWNYGRGDDAGKAEYNYLREVDYCSGACLAARTQDFISHGGFDEAFVPAYCEDSDFCLRMRSLGFKVVYQPACTVVHFEGASNGTDTSSGLKAYQVRNTSLLYERWKDRLRTHRPNGVLPSLERERGVSRRILYIDATMVTPDQDSGSVRVRGVLKTAREHGCKVTFIADNLEYKSPYVEDLQQLGVEVRYWPQLPSIDTYLEQEGAFFDVIILSRYYVAEKHIESVRRFAPQALVALDTHDLHFLRLRRLAELDPSAANSQAAEEAYAKEMAIMEACDVTLVVSPVEQELLARERPSLDVRIFTNIHDVADEVPAFDARNGIMFVGGYRHPPNVDAVLWYVAEVLPKLKQMLPGVKTHIIGSNAPESITRLADEALEVVGFVPDMTPWLQRVRVSISPLRYGAGVKGKINQAMSHGLPVVGTSPSVEGMYLEDGLEVLVADDPTDFAEAIRRLHTDAALWNRLSVASLENVRRHFSSDAAWAVMDGLFRDAAERRQHGRSGE